MGLFKNAECRASGNSLVREFGIGAGSIKYEGCVAVGMTNVVEVIEGIAKLSCKTRQHGSRLVSW